MPKTHLCVHADDAYCVWCICLDSPEPTLEEVLECMKGEFIENREGDTNG